MRTLNTTGVLRRLPKIAKWRKCQQLGAFSWSGRFCAAQIETGATLPVLRPLPKFGNGHFSGVSALQRKT